MVSLEFITPHLGTFTQTHACQWIMLFTLIPPSLYNWLFSFVQCKLSHILNSVELKKKLILSATLIMSSPLQNRFSFIFCPRKDTCLKNSLVVLHFSFFASPQAKNDFWLDHPCGQRSNCKFHRFCPVRRNSNNMAHGIISCYKL